ncbi:hypothetical protein [Piscinibacter koreensis]|uniref:Phosphoglycerate mutase n=1 Tax=Piscinibacter koreensis TaxID=2742824 RepID=A0A7Y6NLH6_9BURK|nr:hypothetical protein [Schlegelella koreensis]NUZ05393.1 hypothetical protein [Schlegelella koreensis]
MHLLIPFASAVAEAAEHVLREAELPNLARLLRELAPASEDRADEYTLSPPHERALAGLRGWRGADGALPFAAHAAAADGIDVGTAAWGLLTPVHWHVGRDTVTLVDPSALALNADESRALFDAVRELFASEGLAPTWGAAGRWYVAADGLDGYPTASIDRAIGRSVDHWLRSQGELPDAARRLSRTVQRLQSECQMLLYSHPVNEAREGRGTLPVNSFWLSGCGRAQPTPALDVVVDSSLRTPMLAGDWRGWAAAWRALDAGTVGSLADAASRGEHVALTLCGERAWQRLERAPRSWLGRVAARWQRGEPVQQRLLAL